MLLFLKMKFIRTKFGVFVICSGLLVFFSLYAYIRWVENLCERATILHPAMFPIENPNFEPPKLVRIELDTLQGKYDNDHFDRLEKVSKRNWQALVPKSNTAGKKDGWRLNVSDDQIFSNFRNRLEYYIYGLQDILFDSVWDSYKQALSEIHHVQSLDCSNANIADVAKVMNFNSVVGQGLYDPRAKTTMQFVDDEGENIIVIQMYTRQKDSEFNLYYGILKSKRDKEIGSLSITSTDINIVYASLVETAKLN